MVSRCKALRLIEISNSRLTEKISRRFFKNLDLLRITFSRMINVAEEASVSKDYRRISDI